MSNKDYYKVLGVSKSASHDEIKAAFKKLARKYHPDICKEEGAEDKFKEISEAYEVLGDEKKRKQFDQFGSFNFGNGGPQNPFSGFGGGGGHTINDVDLNDIFADLFGFGGPQRGRRSGNVHFDFGGSGFRQAGRKGSDLQWSLPIDFLDAVNGCEKQILLHNGQKVKVKIPAGMSDGSKIRLAGKGNPGVAGGAAGDLIIELKVKDSGDFYRDGNNIHSKISVDLKDALNGVKIDVPTISGSVQMKIPANVQSGQKLRLKGKGVTNTKTKAKGDHFVEVLVKYPKDIKEKDKKEIIKILEKY